MVKFIITAPLFDQATRYSHECAKEVVEFLKGRGEDYIFLEREDAVRESVELVLRENPEAYYFFSDHGREDSLIGNDSRPIIDMDNVELLKNRDNYTIACLSGKILGKEAKREGAKSYLGYVEVVCFTTGKFWKGFRECFNSGFYTFYETGSYQETDEEMRGKYSEWAIRAANEGNYISASCFIHDRDSLVLYDLEEVPRRCALRAIAMKAFGRKIGARITRKAGLSWLLFGVGWGLTAHDLWLHITSPATTPWRIHGGYIGLTLLLAGFLIKTYEYLLKLKE